MNGRDENALDDIKKTMGIVLDQFTAIPHDALPHEWAEMKKFIFSETKIPAKYRELMGLAVASATHCPYCIHFHTRAARMNGATDDEIAETAFSHQIHNCLVDPRGSCFPPAILIWAAFELNVFRAGIRPQSLIPGATESSTLARSGFIPQSHTRLCPHGDENGVSYCERRTRTPLSSFMGNVNLSVTSPMGERTVVRLSLSPKSIPATIEFILQPFTIPLFLFATIFLTIHSRRRRRLPRLTCESLASQP